MTARPASPAARRRTNLTGRAAVLAVVACLLSVALAYPLREWLAQRAEIAEVRADVAAQERRVTDLTAEQQRWKDPAYVKAQARTRLHFVMPGETAYIVLDPREAPAPSGAPVRPARERPWFGHLWQSVQTAGASGAPGAAGR